jgi:hypothetical protein
MKITLHKGGTKEKTVPVTQIEIPDLWHLARSVRQSHGNQAADAILKCWHIAHDLRKALEEIASE